MGCRITVGHLLLESRSCRQVEVAKNRRGRLRVRISLIVETETQRQGEILPCFPSVLDKHGPCFGSSVPTPKLLLAGDGVVHDTGFRKWGILRQRQQVVEGERWMRPRPLERLHVIAVPTFVAHLIT